MSFSIRPALPEDADAIMFLLTRAYAKAVAEIPNLPDVTGGVTEEIAAGHVWVVEGVGLLGVLMMATNGEHAHLMNVASDPAARGMGVGKALIAHAEDLAQNSGHSEIHLATHKDMGSNVALYRALGYEVTHESGVKVMMRKFLR